MEHQSGTHGRAIDRLVGSKLSASHQDRWHQDKTLNDSWNDQRTPGEKFLA